MNIFILFVITTTQIRSTFFIVSFIKVALNLQIVKGEEKKGIKKLDQIFHEIQTAYDPMKVFNLNVFYDDLGLVVDPEYRGLGIARNFLKVRLVSKQADRWKAYAFCTWI